MPRNCGAFSHTTTARFAFQILVGTPRQANVDIFTGKIYLFIPQWRGLHFKFWFVGVFVQTKNLHQLGRGGACSSREKWKYTTNKMSIYKRYFLKIRRGDLWSSATNGEISANGRAKHAPTEIVRSHFICNMHLFSREEQAPPLPCLIYFGYLCEAITHR